MDGPDSTGDDEPISPTLLIRVAMGVATPAEEDLVVAAMRDPRSEVHRWLDSMQEWSARRLGGAAPSSLAKGHRVGGADPSESDDGKVLRWPLHK